MSNIKSKQESSKKKTIIIISVVLVALVGLGAGLGVAFGGTSGTNPDITKTDNNNSGPGGKEPGTLNNNEGTYWKTTEIKDPSDENKQIRTLRIKKETKTEEQLKEAYDSMISKGVDVNSFEELLLPYHIKSITEDKIKEALHMEASDSEKIGYIFHKEDYDKDFASKSKAFSGGYKELELVEVNLPEDIEILPDYTFSRNKIKKVNWSELTKLKNMGSGVFSDNNLTGDLDLSGLTSLKIISDIVFAENNLSGILTLPPNITTIGQSVFNTTIIDNKRNKLKDTLKLPKTLETIGFSAFSSNEIEVLDWNDAESLTDIQPNAFAFNKIKTLDFNSEILPKLTKIGSGAFQGNPGQNNNNEMFINDFTLPKNLVTIEQDAIKVKDGITVTISSNATGITNVSFQGGTVKFIKS